MGIGLLILLSAVLCLAYANGANDNFKGVATLFGSGTTNYRRALIWATGATLLGSLAAVLLAGTLLKNFSGKGLVSDAVVANADYAAAVALGAGLSVLVATRIGMPVSTTHALIGALVGAGFAAGSPINLGKLGGTFFLPLLASPILSVVATVVAYPLFRFTRRSFGITAETCLCVGNGIIERMPALDHATALQRVETLSMRLGDTVTCRSQYHGEFLGLEAGMLLDRFHFASAGMVSFARGLNDTPKIAALLIVAPMLEGVASVVLVGSAIAVGGLISARRVAETMSHGITTMNHGQGFTANLLTSLIVIGASRLGMPVSTTHVSCGALFGIGAVTWRAKWLTIGKILVAWITILPLGAALGAASMRLLRLI